jgi:hypothetical protein
MGTSAFNTQFPSTGFVFAGPMIRNHQSQDLCDSQAANEFRKCWPPRFKIGIGWFKHPTVLPQLDTVPMALDRCFKIQHGWMRRLFSCWHHRFPLWPAFISFRTPRTCQQWTIIGGKPNYFLGPQIKDIITTTSPANSIRRLVQILCLILRFASYKSYTTKTKIAKIAPEHDHFQLEIHPLNPSLGEHMLVWGNQRYWWPPDRIYPCQIPRPWICCNRLAHGFPQMAAETTIGVHNK